MSKDPNEPGATDPLGVPIDPSALHKYLYAGGNPVSWIDPTCRDMVEDVLVIENRSLSAAEYLNAVVCLANIVITGATTVLTRDLDRVGRRRTESRRGILSMKCAIYQRDLDLLKYRVISGSLKRSVANHSVRSYPRFDCASSNLVRPSR